jgi:amidophosphoribosyltransferase
MNYSISLISTPVFFQKQSDLAAMMEVIHHYLSIEEDKHPGKADVAKALRKAASLFDGGFTVGGLTGSGCSFVLRDAHGIRPAYYYINNEGSGGSQRKSSYPYFF